MTSSLTMSDKVSFLQIFKVEEGNLILQTPDDPIVKLIFTKDSNLVYIVS